MFKLKVLVLGAAMIPFVAGAQNLVKNGDAENNLDNWDKNQVQVVTENPHSGKNCFKTVNAYSSEAIPVDADKAYKISGWFKSVDNRKVNLYFGLMLLDADKKIIPANSVNAVAGSEAELAEACKPEDTVLKLKNASKWEIYVCDKFNHVAFETDNSGEYKDLPNLKISSSIVKVEQKGNLSEVTLEKPCGKAYPENTTVRIQKDGGFMYPLYFSNFQSPEWKELTALIKGAAKSGNPGNQFWAGTKYARIVILPGNIPIYFDDVKFEEVK